MAKINESSNWEDEIHLIERLERVVGGRGGVANIQARQLAARTRYLLMRLNAIADARELTFVQTTQDPDGTIAGLSATSDGEVFRVAQGLDAKTLFIFYLNNNGVAEKIGAMDSDQGIGRRLDERIGSETFFDEDSPLLTISGKHGAAWHLLRQSGLYWKNIELNQRELKNEIIDIRDNLLQAGSIAMTQIAGGKLYLSGKHGFTKIIPLTSVTPAESVESDAREHWIFGVGIDCLSGLNGRHNLNPQGVNLAFENNHVTLPAWGGALVSDIPDSLEYTRCAVVRYDGLKGISLFNNSDYALTIGGGRFVITSETKTGDAMKVVCVEKGMDTQGWYIPAHPGDWIFIAVTERLSDTGASCARSIFIGGQAPLEIREPDNKIRDMAAHPLAIGNAWSDNANYKTNPLVIAEAIVYDTALNSDEIQALYVRRKQAMAARGLNVF